MQPNDTRGLLIGAPAVMSTDRVAQEMDGTLTARALQALRFRGAGPPYVKVGARVFYLRADVEAWLLRQRKVPSSEIHNSASTT